MTVIEFKKGYKFYKGYRTGPTTVLQNSKYFFLTNNLSVVGVYMHLKDRNYSDNSVNSLPHICTYKSTRPIRLLNLTVKTINEILKTLSEDSNGYKSIQFAFGNVSKDKKIELLKQLVNTNMFNYYKNNVSHNNKRRSFLKTDKMACKAMCEYFKINNLDGYYFGGQEKSNTTSGFHAEIMLCDASNKLLQIECIKPHGRNIISQPNKKYNMFMNVLVNKPTASVTYNNLSKMENIYGGNEAKSIALYNKKVNVCKHLIAKQTTITNLNKTIKQTKKYCYIKDLNNVIKKQRYKLSWRGWFGI